MAADHETSLVAAAKSHLARRLFAGMLGKITALPQPVEKVFLALTLKIANESTVKRACKSGTDVLEEDRSTPKKTSGLGPASVKTEAR